MLDLAEMAIRVPTKPAHAYQHGNLRAALVQAGLRLLSEGGVKNLSLRAAAELAGVSHSAPYRHFADKEALVAAIAEEGFKLFAKRLRAAVAQCPSAPVTERLQALALGYVTFALQHPAYLRVIFGGFVDTQNAPESLRVAGADAYGVLLDLVTQGVTSGELRATDPNSVALACWCLTHGLGTLLADRALAPGACDAGEAADLTKTVTELLFTGILKE